MVHRWKETNCMFSKIIFFEYILFDEEYRHSYIMKRQLNWKATLFLKQQNKIHETTKQKDGNNIK